jgi:hypothetical protein
MRRRAGVACGERTVCRLENATKDGRRNLPEEIGAFSPSAMRPGAQSQTGSRAIFAAKEST